MVYLLRCFTHSLPPSIDGLPIKNGDFPIKNSDFPWAFSKCFHPAGSLVVGSKVPQRAAAESQSIPGEAHGQLEAERRERVPYF